MPDWDEDSPKLQKNLSDALHEAALAAERREDFTVEQAKHWQMTIMSGLRVPDPRFVGAFRGEPGLERVDVRVGSRYGVSPSKVAESLQSFEAKLDTLLLELDRSLPPESSPNADQLAAVLATCAWAHSEWIRIHPFANGNGRTARLWANSIAMRYGLPPFVPLRPRPGKRYAQAAAEAMRGEWEFTTLLFQELLDDFLSRY